VKASRTFKYGAHDVTIETGAIARQADGAVLVNMADTVVLVTAVGDKKDVAGRDFFPLTVNYQEKTFAAGKIPGGFFKREGRPSEKETLTSRLIDRPIRPLFPDGYRRDVQIIATVLSMNTEIDPDIPALLGASAALMLSGLPFMGPIGAARVGYKDGQYLLNPTRSELQQSKLDLVVAGTQDAVLMVESEADRLSEDVMLGAVMFGHEQMQIAIEAIRSLAKEVGRPAVAWTPPVEDTALVAGVARFVPAITEAYGIPEKLVRYGKISELKKQCVAELTGREGNTWTPAQIDAAFHDTEYKVVRGRIMAGKPRIDGRDTKTVRKIDVQVGILPRTHGSAVFTRGETQALVVTTLGTGRDAQIIDALEGERKDPFMLHYNFPPYSVNETGFIGSPKRREIGHGRLARRGVEAVMPDMETFPYVIRVVSEITESNGSSSMASVCGTSLSLMDAGVPIKAPVAGVAMGLIKEDSGFQVLTDILGDEDHLGDMDFKVAGTEQGITSLQMDIKIAGITEEIMRVALEQAQAGRTHILAEMNKALTAPRAELGEHAPRIETMQIPVDKIREVIGSGGKVIREIVEKTGAKIDINDDGLIKIASADGKSIKAAYNWIRSIVAEPEVNVIYEGTVVKVMEFGAFVNFFGSRDGLVHISELAKNRVGKVTDVVKEGDKVKVKFLGMDERGKVRLSMKVVNQETGEDITEQLKAERDAERAQRDQQKAAGE